MDWLLGLFIEALLQWVIDSLMFWLSYRWGNCSTELPELRSQVARTEDGFKRQGELRGTWLCAIDLEAPGHGCVRLSLKCGWSARTNNNGKWSILITSPQERTQILETIHWGNCSTELPELRSQVARKDIALSCISRWTSVANTILYIYIYIYLR